MSISRFDTDVESVRNGKPLEETVEALLSELSKHERLSLLDGDTPFYSGLKAMLTEGYNCTPYVHGAIKRLGIPGLRFTDGPRGVVMGEATAFPVSMARGATWDVSLEERIGVAIGREARALGANLFGGVCINLPRHPAWGRVQETYSEDPILLGEFGAVLTRGIQRNVMATAKHYALNSMENARFHVDVTASEEALHEVYLPHFKRVVDEGVSAIMSAYNSVNGEWAGQNEPLLDGILRQQWGFKGVVISDFIFGLRDAALSLRAGLDVEEPFVQQRAMHLQQALEKGDVATWDHVTRACRRILATQIKHYVSRDLQEPDMSVVFCDDHRKLAREVSARSMVLLQNDTVHEQPLLPLDRKDLSRVAVIGRLADKPNTGDNGSSSVSHCSEVVTPFQGLKHALPDASFTLSDEDNAKKSADAALAADVAIIIVGYTAADEGEYIDSAAMTDESVTSVYPPPDGSRESVEMIDMFESSKSSSSDRNMLGSEGNGGDRKSLRLRPIDAEIISAVAVANPRTIVCVVTAGAVIMEEWRHQVPGLLISWYSGTQGGNALADVLFGDVDSSGRLPYSIPKSENHLPPFDPVAHRAHYDRWHGQRLLDRLGEKAAFPLGYGLSYTSFQFSNLRVQSAELDKVNLAVTVTNTGHRPGRQIVQIYGRPLDAGDKFPSRVLLGFTHLDLDVREAKQVTVTVPTQPLKTWVEGRFELVSDSVVIEVARFAGDQSVTANINFGAA